MKVAPLPDNELDRIAELKKLGILDTEPEHAFDAMVQLAAYICQTPIAAISLIDEHRQWFKASIGLSVKETSRDVAFCAHTILHEETMIVQDAQIDERFCENPLVTSSPEIRFYAGVPLKTTQGAKIGTLCVIDHVPRELSLPQLTALKVLADNVMAHINLRQSHKQIRLYVEDLQLAASIIESSSESMIITDAENRIVSVNQAFSMVTGYQAKEVIGKTPSFLKSGKQTNEFYQEMWSELNKVGRWRGEVWNKRKNGELYAEMLFINIIFNVDGTKKFHVGVFSDITERKLSETELKESHRQLHSLLNSMAEGAYGVDTNGNCKFVNNSFLRILGYENSDEVIGKHIHELIHHSHPDGSHYPATECKMYNAYRNNQAIHVDDEVFWKKDGRAVAVEYWSEPIYADGVLQGAIATFYDISERKLAEEKIKKSISLLNATLEATTDAILVVDLKNTWILYNQHFIDLWQIPDEIIASKDDNAALLFVLDQVENEEKFVTKVRELYQTPLLSSFDKIKFKDGKIVERFSKPQFVDMQVVGRVWSFRDVTERSEMEEQVHQLAFNDPLTKLPNRRQLMDRLNFYIASSKRTNAYATLMFLDLDNFKPLNDTYGHVVGDLLLIEVAKRLKQCVREADMVARFGGDEFVVMLNELGSDKASANNQSHRVAEKIRASLAAPYLLTNPDSNKINEVISHQCSTSVGVVVFNNHEGSLDDILKWADSAMYRAKQDGRNLIRFYDGESKV
jgi:diguanylate cyclase (GGDEF)-like protein/PAS domain S-box-containing protein